MSNSKYSPEEIRSMLLSVAKTKFLQNGIAATEMKEIAAEAGLSRSTLYRYVVDRNQLAFMVSEQVVVELTNKCLALVMGQSLCGFDKLSQFAHHFVATLCENIPVVNFLSEFDCLFRRDIPDIPEAANYAETMKRMLNQTSQFVFEGLSDGSIKSIDEPVFYTSVLINTIFGLTERTPLRKTHYEDEPYTINYAMITSAVEILLRSIKA